MADALIRNPMIIELPSDSSDESDSQQTTVKISSRRRSKYNDDPDYCIPKSRRSYVSRPISFKRKPKQPQGIGFENLKAQVSSLTTEANGAATGRRQGRPPKRDVNADNSGEGEKQLQGVPRATRSTKCREALSIVPRSPVAERPRNVLAWLIDSNTLINHERIWYVDETKRLLLMGSATQAGVLCSCCDRVITVQEFEHHAGGNRGTPYGSIYILSGSTLVCLTLSLFREEVWARQGFNDIVTPDDATDAHDDACIVCADGGKLICCEDCPSTFHAYCMDLPAVPKGKWYCPYCCCKYCNEAQHLSETCTLCAKQYHRLCSPDPFPYFLRPSFCENSCKEIFEGLKRLVGKTNKLDGRLSWTLLQRNRPQRNSFDCLYNKIVGYAKLSVAWTVMEECFMPIIDRQTGIDLIKSVVFNCGSNFNRINFNGFYTVILESGDEIISVATLRIHGTRFAEMPFIATREHYRRQGMCGKLLNAIEWILAELRVENLVIPSISKLVKKWTRFGFGPLQEELKKELKNYNALMFHGAVKLQKSIPPRSADEVEAEAGAEAGAEAEAEAEAEVEIENKQAILNSTSNGPAVAFPFDLNLPPENDEMNDQNNITFYTYL